MSPERTRCRYTVEFKAEVALATLTERQPLAELAAHYQLTPAQISRWKRHLRQQAAQVFVETSAPVAAPPDVQPLYTAIGHLQMENALLKKLSPDEHGPATHAGAGYPSWRLGSLSLLDTSVGPQQLLLPA